MMVLCRQSQEEVNNLVFAIALDGRITWKREEILDLLRPHHSVVQNEVLFRMADLGYHIEVPNFDERMTFVTKLTHPYFGPGRSTPLVKPHIASIRTSLGLTT